MKRRPLTLLLKLLALLVLLLVLATAGLLAYRPGMDEVARHRYVTPPGAAGLQLTWFGTDAVLIRDGQHAVMIDPFFSRPPGLLRMALNREIAPDEALIAASLKAAGIAHLDAVLVSHSHHDHAMDAGVVARLTGAQLLGSQSTANIGRGAGLPEAQIHPVRAGERYTFGDFTLRFIPSRHAGVSGGIPTGDIVQPLKPPARYLDYRQGGSWSIVIESPRGRVLHHGSAGFEPGALRGVQAETVLLGVALIEDLPAYLSETVDLVGAQRVIPLHWDDFTRPLSPPLKPFPLPMVNLPSFFKQMAELRPQMEVQTLEPGREVVLP